MQTAMIFDTAKPAVTKDKRMVNITGIFDVPEEKPAHHSTSKYGNSDIVFTVNKEGDREMIRVIFRNEAYKWVTDHRLQFVQFSNVEKMADRVYFNFSEIKQHALMRKLYTTSNGNTKYTVFRPNDRQMAIFKVHYVNRGFTMLNDPYNHLWYVTCE